MITVNLMEKRPFFSQVREAVELRSGVELADSCDLRPEALGLTEEEEQELAEMWNQLEEAERPLNELFYEVNQNEEE